MRSDYRPAPVELTDLQPEAESDRIGRYRVLRRLAVGGMGEVFLARHEGPAGFAKTLVVKRILKHLASDPRFIEMFVNEARIAALLSHPNVVQIFELGEDAGAYFIAMEYIAGRSLRAVGTALRARGQTLEPTMAARIAAQALHGLQYAHVLKDDRGRPLEIVHRDVSPDNILVGFGGAVKLLDFGIAKAVAAAREHTRTLRGKFAYMSPEQLRGEVLDRRADLYSMGVVLYELLTSRLPYTALSPSAILDGMGQPPARPSTHSPSVPRELEEIILTALAQDPARRFQSAEEMASALIEFASRHSETMSPGQMDGFLEELFGENAAAMAEGMRQRTRPLAGAEEAVTARSAVAPVVESQKTLGEGLFARGGRWPRVVVGSVAAALVALLGVAVFGPRSPVPIEEGSPAPKVEEAPPRPDLSAAVVAPRVAPEPVSSTGAGRGPDIRRMVRTQPVAARGEPKPRNGRVEVRVHPWAEVLLGGRSYGTTPLAAPLTVAAGRQMFVLRNSDLGVERRIFVTVPAGGEPVVLEANLMSAQPRSSR